MQMQEINTKTTSILERLWFKVPISIQAILIGFTVNTLGVGIWVLTASYLPVPWPVLVMAMILFIYWKYFSGNWRPKSSQSFRRFCFRQTKLSKPVWTWGLIASFLLFVFLNSGLVLTFRIVEFQPDVFKTARYLESLPMWISWSFLIMASMVAGICEEVGFRGYMQKPLENKYGPIIGISIVSFVFVLVHLHQAWAGGVLIHIFVVSFMIGYLAYASNSLLPGIFAHITFDIVNFSYWWSDVAGTFEHKPIGMTGVDIHFILVVSVVSLSALFFVFAIRKLLALKQAAQS